MNFKKHIQKIGLIALLGIGLTGLSVLPTAEAGIVYHADNHQHWDHRHWDHGGNRWHHHDYYRHNNFGPGVFLGAAVGFLAGAAVASEPPYECRQVTVDCYTHYGYYGPYQTCYRTVHWVC